MELVDQLNNKVNLNGIPKRVISLVPSLTESLCELGLEQNLVGITKFCVHPKHLRKDISLIGGTKSVKIEKVKSLSPDLIIANKEENTKDDIEALSRHFPVYVSDIININDIYNFHNDIGKIIKKTEAAKSLNSNIKHALERCIDNFQNEKVLYLIWKNPLMGAASNTFINTILNFVGLRNVLEKYERYPEVKVESLNPDLVFLSSEPFPFKTQHINELNEKFPKAKIILVDGEVFSWYGPRLMHLNKEISRIKNILIKF